MRISTATECAQAAIVEALHDGRLGPQEVASIERHLAVCAACAAHRQVLVAIRAHVRVPPRLPRGPQSGALQTSDDLTPLAHQRARHALLRAAVNGGAGDEKSGGVSRITPSRLRTRVAPFALAAVFLSIALFAGWSWGRSSKPTDGTLAPNANASLASASGAPLAQSSIDPENGARFERARIGGSDEVRLTTGTLRVRSTSSSGARLVVRVGGAVLQPKESVFRVTAAGGEIRSVVVEEGSVELEVAGYYAEIPAGGSWRAPGASSPPSAEPSASAPPSAEPSASPSASASPAPSVAIAPPPVAIASTARSSPIVDAPPSKSPAPASTSTSPPKKTNGFSTAMRAMDSGDNDAAAKQMEAFSKAHPDDPRADEADYMRAIALERAGRVDDAKAAARAYLAKWPSGAHRAAALVIVNR